MNQNKYLTIIIIAVVFGLISGIVGELIAKAYILENSFSLPLFGEINLSNNKYGGSNLIIRDAKNVVVEQDKKINDTINAVAPSYAGIFSKTSADKVSLNIKNSQSAINQKPTDYFFANKNIGQGIVVTSDGWILTGFQPEKFLNQIEFNKLTALQKEREIIKNFFIATADKKIYSIKKVVFDPVSSFSFYQIEANDLPVLKFAAGSVTSSGQLLVAVNWAGWSWLATIAGYIENQNTWPQSSDRYVNELILNQPPKKEYYGSYLFNLNGELTGVIRENGKVESIYSYTALVSSFLKNQVVKRSGLGVSYIELGNLVSPTSDSDSQTGKGALIYKNADGIAVGKGSPAEKAGLREGDVILSVNNIEINKEYILSRAISQFIAGDEINISYSRNGVKNEVDIKLAELK